VKIRLASKNSASSFAFEASGGVSLLAATSKRRARWLPHRRGNAASVSKIWLTAPSLFCAAMIGVARRPAIKSRELKFSPSGLNKPPAPSTSKTSNAFASRECARALGKLDALPFPARGKQRRNRRAEMPRVDFIERQRAVHGRVQFSRVGAAAGANGFERRRVDAALAQKSHQQRGQNRFADAGVRAGDEERLLHSPTSKRKRPLTRHQNR
jgi:hypothetical protein